MIRAQFCDIIRSDAGKFTILHKQKDPPMPWIMQTTVAAQPYHKSESEVCAAHQTLLLLDQTV